MGFKGVLIARTCFPDEFGRPVAGLVAYINRSISEETSYGIFLIIDKTLFQSEKDVLLCFEYLPQFGHAPIWSPFYS